MSKVKGKVIFNIPVTSAVPYVISVDKAAAAVFQKYGAKWVEYTNQGTPNEWTAGINQAIARNADAIILAQGTALSLIIPAMQKAKAAGIPIIVTHDYQNGELDSPPPNGPGAEAKALTTAFVNVPFWEAARLEADWAIAADQRQGERAQLLVAGRAAVNRHHGRDEEGVHRPLPQLQVQVNR